MTRNFQHPLGVKVHDLTNARLIHIVSLNDMKDEAEYMRHALYYMATHKMLPLGTQIYSLRQPDGERILTMSVKPDKVCSHIVGFANRQATAAEVELVTRLLEAEGYTVNHDPESTK